MLEIPSQHLRLITKHISRLKNYSQTPHTILPRPHRHPTRQPRISHICLFNIRHEPLQPQLHSLAISHRSLNSASQMPQKNNFHEANPNMYKRDIDPQTNHVSITLPQPPHNPPPPSTPPRSSLSDTIPPSVLQYERQLRKVRASTLSSQKLTPSEHLCVIHSDSHIVVTNKPSGILSVPGLHDKPSLLQLVHEAYGSNTTLSQREHMIVHRLDMDTSGILLFARTPHAMQHLHKSFRDRRDKKIYEALLCGHVREDAGRISLPLQRDHRHPPFMRVATKESEKEAESALVELRTAGFKKLVKKKAKGSVTEFRVLGREVWMGGAEVTRVELTPVTGRTHQLRVHCAAMGHPIVGDRSYGIFGEASVNGGFEEHVMEEMYPGRASIALQKEINNLVMENDVAMCLHAREFGITHPGTEEWVVYKADPQF